MNEAQIERHLQARMARRHRAEDRAFDRYERKAKRADRLIGELVRDGKPVSYVWPAGGKYREGSHAELVEFLIRNHYV